MARELFVLGTASQVPTRHRNHNSFFLQWDAHGVLFDPGEGTQRQMTIAGLAASSITDICITHFHGDHSLGLAGVIQRLSLDKAGPVRVFYPASGQVYFDRLRGASIFQDFASLTTHPIERAGVAFEDKSIRIETEALEHSVDCFGYRIREKDALRMRQDRLDALGLAGPVVGELLRSGQVTVNGRTVQRDEVTEPRRGQSFGFVMDTRPCAGARALAADADLLLSEATFLESDAEVAHLSGHMTARQAGRLAREAGARKLVIGHFSQRYPDSAPLLAEAQLEHDDVVVAVEPDVNDAESRRHRIAVPERRQS